MGQHIRPLLFEEEHLVRTVEREDGEIWFVGIDVCRLLGIKDHKQALEKLDSDERGHVEMGDLHQVGGALYPPSDARQITVISEPGVYRLVFTSRKPIAERFKRWLAHEVIPRIRRTGAYVPEDAPDMLPPPPPPERRTFPDWPMEEMRTKKAAIDMYRMLYGVMAAQWVAPQLGFPVPPKELVDMGRQINLPFTREAIEE